MRYRPDFLAGVALIAILTLVSTPVVADAPAGGHENRLSKAASPYLLQHAHNPVDWYPWGDEAIARARAENKPIFISIGYSTCYWCHVAERTIYSNPAIAALMNHWFINIKVDREERPDLDQTFMLARQMLTGSGGWPNNLFLTPDLKPFFAGSYFPPEDRNGATGFPAILKAIHEQWQRDPKRIRDTGEQVFAALGRVHDLDDRLANKQSVPPKQWLATARDQALSRRDDLSGGLDSGGPKFPQSPMLHLLLTDYRLNGTTEALATVGAALEAMAHGGIHDHLGGGMHRYSTEPTWSVPHFEKMLYDNAQLLGVYAEYYAITRRQFARDMAADLAGYVTDRMMAPGGGYFTAEDADIDGREGETYVWTRDEIVRALGQADADRLLSVYTLAPLPGDPNAVGVLRIRIDEPAVSSSSLKDIAPLRSKLLGVRNKRRQPARDEKIVVALNGLAIGALARAGRSLDEPRWIEAARQSADLLWRRAFDEPSGRLRHHIFKDQISGEGFLDDYALLGLGLLSLADATGEPLWRERAKALASAMTARFIKDDGCVATAVPDPASALTAIDLDDQDMPSGTSAAFALLAQLGHSEPKLAKTAAALLDHVAGRINAGPSAWPSLVATTALNAGAATIGLDTALDSAAHVKLTLSADASRDEIRVGLMIDPGYHINANPASDDYLIPTTITVADVPDAKISYPAGRPFKPKFSVESISVYESSASIQVALPEGLLAGLAGKTVKVEVQTCTAQVCLAPATLTSAIP